jgi:AcrR family transcriptional regulator
VGQTGTRARKSSTAATILDAAERLCATHGIEAVSIRDIAAEAGVAIAVIYHHYKSKGNLLRTTLRTRFDEIKDDYIAQLTRLESQESPAVRDIVRALLQPFIHWRGQERQFARRFYALALVSRVPELKEDIDAGVVRLHQVVGLLQHALPNLAPEDICWRLHFTMKMTHQNDMDMARLAIMSKGRCRSDDEEEALARGIAFAEAAFSAPPFTHQSPPSAQPKARSRRRK